MRFKLSNISRLAGATAFAFTLAFGGLSGFCPMCAMVGRKLDKGA